MDWFKDNVVQPIANIGKSIMAGDWKTIAIVAISIAANVILPGSGTLSSNFLYNVALHAVRGAAIGALTGGISSSIMGGNFWQGVRVGLVAGAITGAIQGVTTSEQFKNWTSGNGFRSDDVVKAEQQRVANMKALLPQAQSSDGAMVSAARGAQAAENGTAVGMATELNSNVKASFTGITKDILLGKTTSATGDMVVKMSDMFDLLSSAPTLCLERITFHFETLEQWALFNVSAQGEITTQIYGTEYWVHSSYYDIEIYGYSEP